VEIEQTEKKDDYPNNIDYKFNTLKGLYNDL